MTDPQNVRCPFYGFSMHGFHLLHSNGNQCALMDCSYSPCAMEMAGRPVDLGTCMVAFDRPFTAGDMVRIQVHTEDGRTLLLASWTHEVCYQAT